MEKYNQGEGPNSPDNRRDVNNNANNAMPNQGGGNTPGAGAGGRGRGNAANLSREARVKGGQRSAQVQVRDQHGQFAGRSDKARSREGNQGEQRGGQQGQGGQRSEEGGLSRGESGESTPGR